MVENINQGLLITEDYTNFIEYKEDEKNGKMYPIHKESSLKTKEFLNRLNSKFSSTPEDYIYPQNTRFVKRFGNIDVFVIEWKPSIRTINVKKDMYLEYHELEKSGKTELLQDGDFNKENDIHRFRLSFPYIIWIAFVNNQTLTKHFKLYFRLSPLSSLKDSLILPPLLNIASEHDDNLVRTFCLGNQRESNPNSDEIGIEDQLSLFFNNKFNSDYPDYYNLYREYNDSTMSNYFLWQYMTRKDPLFIFRDNWKVSKYNLKHDLEKSIAGFIERYKVDNLYKIKSMKQLRQLGIIEKQFQKDQNGEKFRLIRDNSEHTELSIGDNILCIGDDLRIDNRIGYLNSIVENEITYDRSLEVEFEDGEVNVFELSNKIKNDIINYYDEIKNRRTRLNEIINHGTKLRPGDYVTPENGRQFMKITDIIKSNDGFVEIRLYNGQKFLNSVKFEKFSYKKLCEIMEGKVRIGSEIQRKQVNQYIHTTYPYKVIKNRSNKISRITNSNGVIKFKLENDVGYISKFKRYKIVDSSQQKILNCSTCRTGLRLINTLESINDGYFIYDGNVLLNKEDPGYTYTNKIQSIKDIFNENGLLIKGTDHDIDLKFNDEVVVADWNNIDEMLKIKKIIGFEIFRTRENNITIDENNPISNITNGDLDSLDPKYIYIKLLDGDMNETKYMYIDMSRDRYNVVHVPMIRKIIRNYGSFNVGDLVKATEPKIEGFPKKDVNKIIAFINDTGCEYPLALMSNTWTIRCNDLSTFFKKVVMDDNCIAKQRPTKINRLTGDCSIFVNPYNDSKYKIILEKNYNKHNVYSGAMFMTINNSNKQSYGFLNPKFDTLFDEEIRENLDDYFPNFRNWYVKLTGE